MKKILLTFTFFTFITIISSDNPYTIKLLTKEEIEPLTPFIAQLRFNTFQKYPYLYAMNKKDELKEAEKFTSYSPALAVAYHNDVPIGFLRGIDFSLYAHVEEFENDIIQEFKKEGLDPEKYYYFTDIIIMPEHRGNKLAPQLFATLEAHGQKLGYQSFCFLTEHHHNHPLKPKDHKSLVPLWHNLGYTKSSIIGYDTCPTYQVDGTIKPEKHPYAFWLKDITK